MILQRGQEYYCTTLAMRVIFLRYDTAGLAAKARAKKSAMLIFWAVMGIVLGSGFVLLLNSLPAELRLVGAILAAVGIAALMALSKAAMK